MAVEYEKYQPTGPKKISNVPLTIEWKNARMIRNHSLRACAREVLNVNRGIDVVKINVIGPPSTGKTTFLESFGHLCHTLSDTPYAVKILKREDLMDMENTLAKLQPMNYFLGFDDVSWLSAGNNKQKLDQIQKTFTEIRHLPGGQDVKMIICFNFHYNLSIPKHLRQADFFVYTAIGSSELENTQKLVGVKNTAKLVEFKKVYQESISTGKPTTSVSPEIPATFSYKIPGKGNKKFTYTWRKPFAPALFWNNDTLRHIVFPSRKWIEPICPVCTGSIEKTQEEELDLQKFKEEILYKFGIGVIRQALRLKLWQGGINTWSASVKQCMTWIEKYEKHKLFNLESVAQTFGLEDRETKLRKKLPDDIINPKEKDAV